MAKLTRKTKEIKQRLSMVYEQKREDQANLPFLFFKQTLTHKDKERIIYVKERIASLEGEERALQWVLDNRLNVPIL